MFSFQSFKSVDQYTYKLAIITIPTLILLRFTVICVTTPHIWLHIIYLVGSTNHTLKRNVLTSECQSFCCLTGAMLKTVNSGFNSWYEIISEIRICMLWAVLSICFVTGTHHCDECFGVSLMCTWFINTLVVIVGISSLNKVRFSREFTLIRPPLHPSLRPSVRPRVRPSTVLCMSNNVSTFSVFSALLDDTLFTFQDHACEDSHLRIRCPYGTTINIQWAQYGRTHPTDEMCPFSGYRLWRSQKHKQEEDTHCLASSALQVSRLCNVRTHAHTRRCARTHFHTPIIKRRLRWFGVIRFSAEMFCFKTFLKYFGVCECVRECVRAPIYLNPALTRLCVCVCVCVCVCLCRYVYIYIDIAEHFLTTMSCRDAVFWMILFSSHFYLSSL